MQPANRKGAIDRSIVAFGKHKGKAWSEVIIFDPSYILWAYENVKNFSLDSAIRSEVKAKKELVQKMKDEIDIGEIAHIIPNDYIEDDYDYHCFDIDSGGRFFGDS
jgi:hypothetical protein